MRVRCAVHQLGWDGNGGSASWWMTRASQQAATGGGGSPAAASHHRLRVDRPPPLTHSHPFDRGEASPIRGRIDRPRAGSAGCGACIVCGKRGTSSGPPGQQRRRGGSLANPPPSIHTPPNPWAPPSIDPTTCCVGDCERHDAGLGPASRAVVRPEECLRWAGVEESQHERLPNERAAAIQQRASARGERSTGLRGTQRRYGP